jgi:hypothetical protein
MHEDFRRTHRVRVASDRSFGLVMAAALAVVAAITWWRSGTPRWWAVAASLTFALVAGIRPAALGPLARIWIRLGLVLHRLTTPVILGVMYFLILTPVARLARFFGHVWLPLERDAGAKTYWHDRVPRPSSMRNQY